MNLVRLGNTSPPSSLESIITGGNYDYLIAGSNASELVRQRANDVCDYVADDIEINAYIDKLPSGGALLLAGSFNLASPLLPRSNQRLFGLGDLTILNNGSSTLTAIYADTKANIQIDNLRIAGTTMKTGGSGIQLYACLFSNVQNVTFEKQYMGIYSTGSTVTKVRNCNLYDNTYAAIAIDGAGVDFWINDVSIAQPGAVRATSGLLLNGISGLYVNNLACGTTQYGVIAATAGIVQNLFFVNSIIDDCSLYAMMLDAATYSGTVRGIHMDNSWFASATIGAYLKSVDDFQFNNGLIINIGDEAFILDTGSINTSICNNRLYAVGVTTPNTYSAIRVAADVSGFDISHNQFNTDGWGFTGTPKYWVQVAAGASDKYVINANIAKADAGTANFQDDGTGVNKYVEGNV